MQIKLNNTYYECNINYNELIIKIQNIDLPFFENMFLNQFDNNFKIKLPKYYKKDIYFIDNFSKNGIFINCYIKNLDKDNNIVTIMFDYMSINNEIKLRNIKIQKILKNIKNDNR